MFKEEEMSRKIIGCAMKVHSSLGPGFKENIYHQAMIVALKEIFQNIRTEQSLVVYYNQIKVGNFRLDLLVEDRIVIEIKAVSGKMPRIFLSQVVSYLKASNLEVGLLLNFGNPSLEFERIVHYLKSV